ncbi:phosphodiester glycosidase family protein [Lentzea sp. NEAU-D7]|uniref:phosphodiester glycosidase family protein n=1 Tax=Lentzea sp. NEAU-D7 TaxID=2994667 RepID=UPI00224A5A69|nr:phosphodiester glycosidase family protein [Lentzea sp. NEAU-D7]MCX2949390.1 phosphodiester glycosidase family protein [Lentzea sp. NEAU-D7]
MTRRALAVTIAAALLAPVPPAHAGSAGRVETERIVRPVAPGVTLSSFDWYRPDGWVRGDALAVDLTKAQVGYVDPGTVSQAAPLSQQAGGAVAAINGDFFDIDDSNAPDGVGIQDGHLRKSGEGRAAGIDAAGVGSVMETFFEGTLNGTHELTQLNSARIDVDGIGVFNSLWGTYSRARAVQGAANTAEVIVEDDVVRSVGSPGDQPVQGYALVGRDKGADVLKTLKPGDRAEISYRNRTSDGSDPRTAIGGRQLLVSNGRNVAPADPLHPRTAVGFSQDGRKMYVLVVDGRQSAHLQGLDLDDLADAMIELGAHNALNLDGGGSSTMLVRDPGTTGLKVVNTPSDGGERPVANGLALYAPTGTGRLTGFDVQTESTRVFPGMTRRMTVRGHDETFGPASDEHVSRATGGWAVGDTFHAASRPGPASFTAFQGLTTRTTRLTVLGGLARIAPAEPRISLTGAEHKPLRINGFDAKGFSAPIERADLDLSYDRTIIEVTPDLRIRALRDGATTIRARAQGKETHTAVTVGVTDQSLATFDDAPQWTFGSARATGRVAPEPDGHTGAGLRLSYDFTQSTGTRTAHAVPPRPLRVDGQPLSLAARVRGTGQGEWTAFTVTDSTGRSRSLYGPHVTWHGWQQIEVAVPPELSFPIQVTRFTTIETRADRAYRGEVVVDDVVARVPPAVTLPPAPDLCDDVIGPARGWTFAVMSDAQFVARAPDSDLVRSARRTLREIRASGAEFVVVNGDFVDEASPRDLAFARRVLTEELGGFPWYYVPGNHEIMGPGTIENFRREFGATSRTFDHRGTRFVLLDSSTGTLRGGGFEQVEMLRNALRTAEGPAVVLMHHPPRDPTPARTSQLDDRLEASYFERLLSERDKPTAFVGGHVGGFFASTVDGVPHVINGNSGKAPAEPGGFTGWTLLGVGEEGLKAETRPHVDALQVRVPATLRPAAAEAVAATVKQGSRSVPVRCPMGAVWEGSRGLHVGGASGVRPWHVARFEPDTGVLTGIRPGQAKISITVNGVTSSADVLVEAPEAP